MKLILLVFILIFTFNNHLCANEQIVVVLSTEPEVILKSDDFFFDQDTMVADFQGNVTLIRDADIITANRGRWDNNTKSAELSGDVVLKAADFTVKAERVTVNLEHNLAKVYNGQAFFPQQNYYLFGEIMERRGADSFYLKKGIVTTCDGPNPPWSITVNDLQINREGYATAGGTIFNTKFAPVFYLPYATLPVKTERQSGLLLPNFTQSSRDGQVISLPIYWATADNHDLTFIPVWRSKRGLSLTLEGNHKGLSSESSWLFTYLDDHKSKIYGYKKDNAKDERFKDRWWLRGKSDASYNGWDFLLDFDLASDPLLLDEFKNDPDGFNYSQKLMMDNFKRGFNESKDPFRRNMLNIRKYNDDEFLNFSLEYTDDLSRKSNRDTIQRLPNIIYDISARPIIGESTKSGYFSLQTQYSYFYRKSDSQSLTNAKGSRLYFEPQFNLPLSVGNWGSLSNQFSISETIYFPTGFAINPNLIGGVDRFYKSVVNNTVLNFDTAFKTSFNKVYKKSFWGAEALKHAITPEVQFVFRKSYENDELIPFWDELDYNPDRRTLRYGLSSNLIAKVKTSPDSYEYFEWINFSVWASHEFSNSSVHSNDQPFWSDYYGHGTGPIELELEINPNKYLTFKGRAFYDSNKNEFISHDYKAIVHNDLGRLSIEYENAKDMGDFASIINANRSNEELKLRLDLQLSDEWLLHFDTRHDLQNKRELETEYSLRYSGQCWGGGISYLDTYDDSRIAVFVDLLGFGSIGGGPKQNY